jgi:hypothetical protein
MIKLNGTASAEVGELRFPCRADALRIGDRVLTPARRWETVTRLDSGERFSRSTRVTTDESGPDYPWVWVNAHRRLVRRPAPVGRVA